MVASFIRLTSLTRDPHCQSFLDYDNSNIPILHLPTLHLGQLQMHPLNRLARQCASKRNLLSNLPQLKLKHPKNPRNRTPKLRLRKVLPNTRPRPMEKSNLRKIRRRPAVLIWNLSAVFISVDPTLRHELIGGLAPEFGTSVDGLRA